MSGSPIAFRKTSISPLGVRCGIKSMNFSPQGSFNLDRRCLQKRSWSSKATKGQPEQGSRSAKLVWMALLLGKLIVGKGHN